MRYGYAVLMGAWLALGAGGPARAQKLVRRFAGSVVLLTSGDTLRGPLLMYSDKDVIVLRQADGTLRTFTPWAVKAFAVKGELTHHEYLLPPPMTTPSPELDRLERTLAGTVDTTLVRVFVSYRTRARTRQRPAEAGAPGFYEMLCEGSVSLLQRESLHLQQQAYVAGPGQEGPTRPLVTPVYLSNFYLFTADGRLTPLRRPRRDLAELLPQQAPELERYARLYRLDYTQVQQLRAIVRYANNLLAAAR